MADFSVQFYVYRNQNIKGIILDKIYNYYTVLVEAYNFVKCIKAFCLNGYPTVPLLKGF